MGVVDGREEGVGRGGHGLSCCSCLSEATAACTARLCLRCSLRAATRRPSRPCASRSSDRTASASSTRATRPAGAAGPGGVAGGWPPPGPPGLGAWPLFCGAGIVLLLLGLSGFEGDGAGDL